MNHCVEVTLSVVPFNDQLFGCVCCFWDAAFLLIVQNVDCELLLLLCMCPFSVASDGRYLHTALMARTGHVMNFLFRIALLQVLIAGENGHWCRYFMMCLTFVGIFQIALLL